ncbi:SDR family NAD(P)-dependent oxidoreductase [Streptomyces sp. NPDC088387]|uniref:SDR family NAD(P)-dependent oxidoreductase n=1 Tax=Streptomyces sp. NPDC088387 TaxID=3365859 RepID=UPI0038205256
MFREAVLVNTSGDCCTAESFDKETTVANSLNGKVAVITGAARGIGAATARTLVREGARVVLGDLREDVLQELVDELGDAAVGVRADVSTEKGVEALVQSAMTGFGRLDVLDNNAAAVIPGDTDAATATDEAWRRTFDLNTMAAVWGARHAVPAMLASDGGGSIINVSSGASQHAASDRPAYGASKAALETFSLYAGAQLGAQGIRSNVIRCGFVLTEATREMFNEDQLNAFGGMTTLGRPCLPEDVAEAVAFLASPASRYINCAVIDVDGGGFKPPAI